MSGISTTVGDGAQEPPRFRFHPFAVSTGAIGKNPGACGLCGKRRGYLCAEAFSELSAGNPGEPRRRNGANPTRLAVCPWCLADGTAARKASRQFQGDCAFDAPIPAEEAEEIRDRTPAFRALQDATWPTHCGHACAFLGYADTDDLRNGAIDARADLEREARERNITPGLVLFMLEPGHAYQGQLFRCVICGSYRLTVASD